MARAWAEYREASFATDGQIYLTYLVTYVDVAAERVEPYEVVAVVTASDTINQMRPKITAAIQAKGTEVGLTVAMTDIIQPSFAKG